MMLLLTVLLSSAIIVLALLCYIWWYQTYSRFYTLLNRVPGPPGYPIIGNVLIFFFTKDLFQLDCTLGRDYYPIYREWSFYHCAVNLHDPDDIEIVLSSNKYIDKGLLYRFMRPWLGTGLLTSSGAKWQNRRKILTPAFHFSILQEFVNIFNEETGKLVGQLLKQCHKPYIDVIPPITNFTLLSIAETSMGLKLDDTFKVIEEYKKAIHIFGTNLVYRIVRPWLYSDLVFNSTSLGRVTRDTVKTLHDFSTRVIAERKKTFSYSTGKRLAMLDLLLAAKERGADIDDEGIREEVDTFMFEGHDTTSLAICYILLLLANHRKVQDEVYAEIIEVLGGDKMPNYQDLKKLVYMERVLKECLRLYPSVPFISRRLREDMTTSTGYTVPKGAMANVRIFNLHHDPRIYPDPEKFDPDRFLPENTKNRHPFAYIPFSAGPRNCIGQRFAMLELKAVVCGILRSFILEAHDRPEDVHLVTDLVLRCKGSIRVKFTPRH